MLNEQVECSITAFVCHTFIYNKTVVLWISFFLDDVSKWTDILLIILQYFLFVS